MTAVSISTSSNQFIVRGTTHDESNRGNFDGFVRITEEEEEDDDDDSNDDIVVDHGRRLDALLPTIFASSHAPFLFESFVGDLFLAWFSGEYEGASRCAIVVSRFDFVANQWGVPAVASVETGKSNQNPVLFQRTSERARLYLLHPSQDASVGFRESQATAEVRLLYSDDRGETWSVPSVIFPRGRGSFVRGGILAAKDDAEAMLLPMYFTPAGEFNHAAQYSCVVRSRDGIHWTNEARIPGSEGARGVQPQLVRLSDGKLVVFMRNRVGNRILRSESIDDGATFTQCTNTELPSNDSGIAALVVDNDLLLLCFNNVHSGRYPLTIALSRDGGLSFLHARDIRIIGGGVVNTQSAMFAGEHSYPSMLLSNDRQHIHVAWTHHRDTIAYAYVSLEWLLTTSSTTIGVYKPNQ